MIDLRRKTKALSIALLAAVTLPAVPAIAKAQTSERQTLVLGAGSSFAAPLYKAWIQAFTKDRPSLSMNYDSVGSGEGISRFVTGSVDFAGTDAPLTDKEKAQAENGALQLPIAAGMIAIAYNLSGFQGDLRLPRDLYPEILAGNVTYWDDPRLVAANPGAKLPHRSIFVVARRDASGTTFALTRHLAEINPGWRDSGPGVGKLVDWREAMLARGNEGVAQKIKISDGVIGYVEFGFAARLGLKLATLENKAGKFVQPTEEIGRATIVAAGGDIPDDLRNYLADPQGEQSYPIMTLTWMLLHERYRDPAKSAALKEFVGWGLTEGQGIAVSLGYLPLPPTLTGHAQSFLARIN
jgi:phosphate transport system substrate-binding protein